MDLRYFSVETFHLKIKTLVLVYLSKAIKKNQVVLGNKYIKIIDNMYLDGNFTHSRICVHIYLRYVGV